MLEGQDKTTRSDRPWTEARDFVVSKFAVKHEDARLLHSLTCVFGHADESEALIEKAERETRSCSPRGSDK